MPDLLQTRKVRLDALRRQIARAAGFSTRPDQPAQLGIAVIDLCLNGGLVRGALHEIAAADHRSIPAALGFLLALTNSLSPSGGEGRGEGDVRSRNSEIRSQTQMRIQPDSDFRFPASGFRSPPHPNPLPTRGRGNCVLWPFAKTARAFGQPYAPGLCFLGLDPARIVFVRC